MSGPIVVLSGGVGGAKLVHGLSLVAPPASVTAIVNTGDDFVHLGLPVTPDIDTVLYTLAGKADRERGWGRADETWAFMAALRELGGPDWFALGDGDLALHVLRLAAFAQGQSLSQITARIAAAWGIDVRVLPMSDERIATIVDTDEGALDFQTYFVGRRCQPKLHGLRFQGAAGATAAPGVIAAIMAAKLVIVAPSNPWLSIDPILAVAQIRDALARTPATVVAVSPLVGGTAVKGPTAKIMAELNLPLDHAVIANRYAPWLDALVADEAAPELALPHAVTDTMMRTDEDRARLAAFTLHFGLSLPRG